jgi:hypothetical protein
MTVLNVNLLIAYCFCGVLCSIFISYATACLFWVFPYMRKRLYKLVTTGGQLIILKEWSDMNTKNIFYTILAMTLHISFWGGSWYVAITFCAVWKDYAMTWLWGWIICLVMEVFIFEIFIEWFISWFYYCRRSSRCSLYIYNKFKIILGYFVNS